MWIWIDLLILVSWQVCEGGERVWNYIVLERHTHEWQEHGGTQSKYDRFCNPKITWCRIVCDLIPVTRVNIMLAFRSLSHVLPATLSTKDTL